MALCIYAIKPFELLIRSNEEELCFSSLAGMLHVFSLTYERSTSHVVSQYSLGRCCHSHHPLATRLARRAYRRQSDPSPAGDSDSCLAVQPLCGHAQKRVGEVLHSSCMRARLFVR